MQIGEFKLERYFAKYEFKVKYLLSASDCESISLAELIGMSDQEGTELWDNLGLGYTQSQGHPLLLDEIAKLYPGRSSDNVLVVAPEEGILIALHSILETGDHLIMVHPAYQSLSEIPKTLGCEVTEWPLKNEDNRWVLDVESLERMITPKTKLIIINFPHNPTGYTISKMELDRIVTIARKHGIYIFSDEMYYLSEYQVAERLEPVSTIYEKGISLSGLSKSFGLPGLRMGWLVSPEQQIFQKFCKMKDYTTICSSAPSEILAIIALRAKEVILKRNLEIIRNNLQIAEKFFTRFHLIFDWIPPKAGPVAFINLKAPVEVSEFCIDVVEKKNLMILPSNVFDIEGNCFRLGLGRKNLKEALGILEEYIVENMKAYI